jgi:N-dimethylarginine dimethylaminohydrolase
MHEAPGSEVERNRAKPNGAERPRFLMCRPSYFSVAYEINPWMVGNIGKTDGNSAQRQWTELYERLLQCARVDIIPGAPGLADMVFAANAAFVLGRRVVLANFAMPRREGEEVFFGRWFLDNGFDVSRLPAAVTFEGAGDCFPHDEGKWLWAGYGIRTDRRAHEHVSRCFGLEVVSVALVDPRFFHLDTCLCPLAGGYVLFYPGAFHRDSLRLIRSLVPAEKRIEVDLMDASTFCCNCINVGETVFSSCVSDGLRSRLSGLGFKVHELAMSEFLKAGGSARCLVLPLENGTHLRGVGGERGSVKLGGAG